MKKAPLYRFLADDGTFRASNPGRSGPLYFPLVNEQGMMSSITPDLGGDLKLDQHSFLTLPVCYEDLHLSRATRNFWIALGKSKGADGARLWSVSGRSVWQRADASGEEVTLDAGLLWHSVTRRNKKIGLEAKVLNYVPAAGGTFEVMHVEIKNISKKTVEITATSAIPLFGRSADNLRDHRHVTSLLNRLHGEKFGVSLVPTMTFNERGHRPNKISYFVLGADGDGGAPAGFFATVESFIGEGGDLERPLSLVNVVPPSLKVTEADQGKEAMGALQFKPVKLKSGGTASFTLLLGVDRYVKDHETMIRQFAGRDNVEKHLQATKENWEKRVSTLQFQTGDGEFNQWTRWVATQPVLRKLFGCSFLPDFDYGRGGRGWRDLWQDCLALLLANPEGVRDDIHFNFGGVRIDGSNATIIGRRQMDGKWLPEFVADRNNIARTWMDHGIWPFLTTLLYLNQTGDWDLLLEKEPYFKDALLARGKQVDRDWAPDSDPAAQNKLKTRQGHVYTGTILEHLMVQALVQFFNVGEHNNIRLEDADWNDGLDMAHDRGESVAFTSLYGCNLQAMADLLESLASKAGWTHISIAEEMVVLLDRVRGRVDYDSVEQKKGRLREYFASVAKDVKGAQALIPLPQAIQDLREKAAWIKRHVNDNEWISHGGESWYNGYYDNLGNRVEGAAADGSVRMTLSGQVYPVMSGVANEQRVASIVKAVNRHLFDKSLGSVRLNTNFGAPQPHLGRAFSFAYGEKENGAVFSHMVVMYANALYQRGFAQEGYRILNSLFDLAKNSGRSGIYPGLPEYFNNEGRGRYMYLTGSASWYVLTLLTQAFGVRGQGGDLLLAPKLDPEQFDRKGTASVTLQFAGSWVTVKYANAKRLPFEKIKIGNVRSKEGAVPFTRLSAREVLIQRKVVSQHKHWNLDVELTEAG